VFGAGVITAVVAAAVTAGMAPSPVTAAVAHVGAILGAVILIAAATLSLPDDAPPAPSWFARWRAERTRRRGAQTIAG